MEFIKDDEGHRRRVRAADELGADGRFGPTRAGFVRRIVAREESERLLMMAAAKEDPSASLDRLVGEVIESGDKLLAAAILARLRYIVSR